MLGTGMLWRFVLLPLEDDFDLDLDFDGVCVSARGPRCRRRFYTEWVSFDDFGLRCF